MEAQALYSRTNDLQLARQQAQDREALAARDLAETTTAATALAGLLSQLMEVGCQTAGDCLTFVAARAAAAGRAAERARLSYDQAQQATATANGFGGAYERQRAGLAAVGRTIKAA